MNKKVAILLTIIVVSLGIWAWSHYTFENYPEKLFQKYTQIDNYSVFSKIHNNHEILLEVKIGSKDGDKLLKKYAFQYGYNSVELRGRVQDEHLWQRGNSWYYLETEGHGHYGYLCLCLSHDKRTIQMLEIFEG